VCVTGVSFLKFSQTYLHTHLAYPTWHKASKWFKYSFVLIAIALTTGGLLRNIASYIELYTAMFSSICLAIIILGCLGLTFSAWRSNTTTGKYYAFSNLVFFICALVYVSGMIFEPLYIFTAPFVKIGITIQMLCFSVALASRINLLKQEIADKRLENERMEKRITEQKNRELEAKVKERTRELEQSNEEIRAQADKIEKQARLIEDHKNRELLNRTLQILQKNELLPTVGKFLEQHNSQLDERARKESKELQKEIQNNLASDTNWESLKMHFEEAHPTLFAELQKLNPDLTKNDLRYCAYLKMGLINKDIAQLLHLDTDSVRKQQYRIKQKLGLDKEISLNDFIKSFVK
jgi:DNA-binding CsgD family transcriptional regulator